MSYISYVINNCPAMKIINDKHTCRMFASDKVCENLGGCVLKQIYEKCKDYLDRYNNKDFYDDDDAKICMGKAMLAQTIVCEYLDIEQVEL